MHGTNEAFDTQLALEDWLKRYMVYHISWIWNLDEHAQDCFDEELHHGLLLQQSTETDLHPDPQEDELAGSP